MLRVLRFFLIFILAGCASQQDMNSLKWEVDALNTRLSKTEQQLREKDRIFGQSLSQQAELHARFTEVQDQLFSIQGRLEEMQMSSGSVAGGNVQARIVALEQDIQAVKDSLGKVPVTKSLYETGVERFRAAQYADAIVDLKSYLGQNPDRALVDNAHFWIGESYYALGKYEDAILRYDLVVKKFTSSEKVTECLLKQGMSFIKMGDKETGELILQQLISGYSNSDAAAKAKKIIKDGMGDG
ncbi:MAG TPA: tol-pal system protein YbgF [Deltaproteobacteria bacterium]|nr:tol-pal system protein YbgF [Deltaproteobacteria bacterium]